MKIKEIKALGKQNFKKQKADLMLIGFASVVAFSAISLFTVTLGYYLIYGPIQFVIFFMFYRNSQGQEVHLRDALLNCKNKWGNSFVSGFIMALIAKVPTFLQGINLLASLLGILTTLDIGGFGIDTIYSVIGKSVSLVLYGINVFAYFVTLSLSMSLYLLVREPELTAGQALQRSREMMYGFKLKYLLFRWSFLGWGVLSVLSIGFSRIYSEAYFYASETVFFNYVYDQNKKLENNYLKGEEHTDVK